MEEPVEPNREDCCNSGCNPCIFEVYEKQMNLYKKFLECGESDTSGKQLLDNGISQQTYTSFEVIKVLEVCSSHKLLFFRSPSNMRTKVHWNAGDHFLIKNNCQISCTRAYTPIKLKCYSSEDYDFSIIIKKYSNGLVSNNVFNLKSGDLTLWRGPFGSYKVEEINKFDSITMVAQGTGIAPFLSIIDEILENEDHLGRIYLLFCCHSVETILFRDELYSFNSFWNFTYNIFITEQTMNYKCKYKEPLQFKKLTFDDINLQYPVLNQQFLLCGSPQFMEEYKTLLMKHNILCQNIVVF